MRNRITLAGRMVILSGGSADSGAHPAGHRACNGWLGGAFACRWCCRLSQP